MKMQSDPLDLSDKCFKKFWVIIHDMMGISIRLDRRTMLSGRLRRRMRELNLETYEDYFEYLSVNSCEQRAFVNAITTNETYFYRTPRIWNYIKDDFLPAWNQQNPGKTLMVWSAASSTGEEAHTLGIVLQQYKDQHRGFDYQILGTDIAPRVVEHAKNGLYRGRAIEQFRYAQPEMFSRYLTGDDENGYQVLPAIRDRLKFDEFNLFDNPGALGAYDLVLLRNVLIYFAKEDQKKVMENLHRALVPRGITIIGESETLNNLDTDFVRILPTVYQAMDASPKSQAA